MEIFGIEIKKREVIVSVAIVLVLGVIGFLIHGAIEEGAIRRAELYNRAYKPANSEQFVYASRTSIGNTLMQGTLVADESVSTSHWDGDFMALEVVHEHYTMHTRVVTYTDEDGDTHTEIETYWSWDEVGRELSAVDAYTFYGVPGLVNDLHLDYRYIGTDHRAFSDDRWLIYAVPCEFEATLFVNLADNRIQSVTGHGVEAYQNSTVNEVVESKNSRVGGIVFTVFWIIFVAVAVWLFLSAENWWLDGGKTITIKIPFFKKND